MSDEQIPTRRRKRQVPSPLRGPKFSAKQEEVQKRRLQALELRKAGLSYSAIAERMQLSTAMVAWRYVNDAIAAIPAEAAKEVKALMLASIDTDLVRLNNLHASAKSVAEVTKIVLAKDRLRETQARLLGLNAPTSHEHSFLNRPVDVRELTDEQIDRLASGDFGVLAEASVASPGAARAAEAGGAEGSDRPARPTH